MSTAPPAPADQPSEGANKLEAVTGKDAVGSVDAEIELVFGITRAVGTPSEASLEQLRNSLTNYGYEVLTVKVSDILKDGLIAAGGWVEPTDEVERVQRLIEEGNRCCEVARSDAALSHQAITEIRRLRRRAYSRSDAADDIASDEPSSEESGLAAGEGAHLTVARRLAFIVDSLKRPGEVTSLRQVYGDHFLLLGLQAQKEQRHSRLVAKLTTAGHHREVANQKATDLIDRDDHEELDPDYVTGYGQDMLGTFPMSDVFVDANTDRAAKAGVERAVQLLFGDPGASGPTELEYGMQLATQTSTMSTELGRRVGAAVLGVDGDLLAVGSNHHPLERDVPAFDAGALDVRQLAEATLDAVKNELTEEARGKFKADPSGYVASLFRGSLRKSDLKAITEYQRAVHAEMYALVSAMRQRVDVVGATVFVTSYPCHNCAKHLLALGLRVVYLEPYAKGRAAAMYGDAVTDAFIPFTGVAPSRFEAWFLEGRHKDRKDSSGMKIEWSGRKKRRAVPFVTRLISQQTKQLRENFVVRAEP